MNKKLISFFIFIIILSGVFLVSSSLNEKDKIDREVYEKLEKSDEVRVVVKIEEPAADKGFLIKTKKTDYEISLEKQETKKEIINEVGEENVRHVFDEEIAIEVSKDELDILNENPNVESVIVDKPIFAFLQESVPYINASLVWPIQVSNINITGINETICILDTGINFTHPNLLGKNKTCIINCITEDCVENCSIGDDNGHGTHVAGIVAASGGINGVAVGANLIGVKVLNSAGEGTGTDLNAGIDWCIANSAAYNISVISMSLGDCSNHNTYCNSDSSAPYINNATGRNISVIIAAGNCNSAQCPGVSCTLGPAAPACVQNATAVGAVNDADNSISYQRGALFELLAPGININSTVPTGSCELCDSSGYKILSGTSMSAPHVAGAFALFRQFFRLQNGRVPTPNEIRTTLNNTGKQINDTSGTNLNYSRIDVWSALISIDTSNPTVNLTLPSNNTVQFTQNTTFRCSANDVQLKNITLYIWNSSGIYNNTETRQVTGTNGNAEFNLTNITYGSYNWNCLAYDSKGNSSFAGSNYSLTVGRVTVNLNSPENNYFTNQNQTYNCSAETESTTELSNITFYIWNSANDLINSSNLTISGTSNYTTFSHNFTTEDSYHWNCLAYNNVSESAWADSNFTITYDVSVPNLTLIEPFPSSETSSSASKTFQYNVSDNYDIANCSLIINGIISLTNSSIVNLSQTQSFTQTFTPNTYNWQVNCTDKAGNQANSSQRSFTITAPSTTITPSSGGGTPTSKTYTITTEQASSGYTQTLSKSDKIKFTFFDEKEEQHTLTINDITSNSVSLTIQSAITKLKLGIGQSAKLNLTSADYYNLYVKLNSISNNKADITIQTIHEQIPKPSVTGQVAKEDEEKTKEETPQKEQTNIIGYIKDILIVILIIAVLVILFSKKDRIREKRIKEYKERFRSLRGKN